MEDITGGLKKHSACDECRKRKLKCSGQQLGCSRCIRQGLPCIYSAQKQMGRPRKPQRSVSRDGDPQLSKQDSTNSSDSTPALQDTNLPDLSVGDQIDANTWAAFIKAYMPPPDPPLVINVPPQSKISRQQPQFSTNFQVPPFPQQPMAPQETSFYNQNVWTDYSSFSYQMPNDNYSSMPSASSDSTYGSAGTPNLNSLSPACSCIANLYLTLSAISPLQSLPVSPHTIETLQTAAHTAHSVIYCRVCPLNFQAGMQNIMMSGTLLMSLADSWSRIIHLPAYDLWQGFYATVPMASEDGVMKRGWDESEAVYWRLWARQLVYKNVFGSNHKQLQQNAGLNHPFTSQAANYTDKVELTLTSIVDAMERRQRMWHNEIPQTDEFIEPQSFGGLVDTVAAMINNGTKKAQEQHAQQNQHHHHPHQTHAGAGGSLHHAQQPQGHAHAGGHGQSPDHFCQTIIRNVRKIMSGIAFLMGVPIQQET